MYNSIFLSKVRLSISPGRESWNFSLGSIFAAIFWTETQVVGFQSYGERFLQFWVRWNHNDLWNINTLIYGPAEDFRRSAEGFGEQQAWKTSVFPKWAESRRNEPKMCRKFNNQNLWTKTFPIVKILLEKLFGALKTSNFSIGWFFAVLAVSAVFTTCDSPQPHWKQPKQPKIQPILKLLVLELQKVFQTTFSLSEMF